MRGLENGVFILQIEEFRKLFETHEHMKNNFRPTKPLNGRIVYRSYEDLGRFFMIYFGNTHTNYVQRTINRTMVQLLKHKCLPILLYALEVGNLDKSVLQSLDFTLNRFSMKLFKTSYIEIVHYSQTVFGCELPSVLLGKRYDKFIAELSCTSV